MVAVRSDDQAVDAFSAPKSLLREAQLEAKRRRMTKSGFYRYCLAKELGHTSEQAERVAENPSVGNFNVVNGQRCKISYSKRKKK